MPANKFEIESIFKGVDRLSRPLGKMGRSLDSFERKAKGNMSAARRSFMGMTTAAKVGFVGMAGAATGVSIALFDAARAGADFEQSITNAAAVMPGKVRRGTDEFKALTDAALEVGATTEFTATQAAGGLEKLGMAGFNARQSIAALPGVIDLATASSTDFIFAADVASDTLSAFGLMTKDSAQLGKNLARVNDVLASTATSANVTLETLFETVSEGGSIAAAANIPFEKFAAMAGVMGNAAIKGSKAGTTMKNVVLRLTDPVGEAAQILDELGVSLDDAAGEMTDPIDALQMLEEGFDRLGITGRKRLAAVNEIYGKIAGPGVNAMLLATTDEIRNLVKVNEEATRSAKAQEIAGFKRDTVLGSTKTLMSAIEGVKLAFAELNRDEHKEFLDHAANWVRNHQPEIVSGMDGMASAIKGIGTATKNTWQTYRGFTEFLSETDFFQAWAKAKDTGFIKKSDQAIWDAVEDTDFIKRMAEIIEGVPKGTLGPGLGSRAADATWRYNPAPEFEPVDIEDNSALSGGRSTTTREEKETTNKVIIEAGPGLKATTSGDENPAIQMAPTGGL